MEVIQEGPFRVIVDYAHTPGSLEKVYKAVKPKAPQRLICVLGSAGGGRDTWKRARFGEIASRYCETILITNEDPYDEMPRAIMDEIASGCVQDSKKKYNLQVIEDRGVAIKAAFRNAKNGDTVIVTGKGNERWIHVAGGQKISWNDRVAVEEALSRTEN